jgi:trans-aconitate 2-methyltransferase
MSSTVDWDAATYDRVAAPQEEWGREVLDRLELRGDETVLDAGCGTGRVTRLLAERLPNGHVIGVDGAPSMIEVARANLEDLAERVTLIQEDLLELELADPVDAVFSNATFHWVVDHDRLFRRLYAALRPGGVVRAQCGGEGNVAEWKRALEVVERDERFTAYLEGMPPTHYFASAADTQARLEATGFVDIRAWLERRTVSPPEPRAFARAAGLSNHLARVPADLQDQFTDAVFAALPQPLVLEYVRLNIDARRPE